MPDWLNICIEFYPDRRQVDVVNQAVLEKVGVAGSFVVLCKNVITAIG